MQINFAGSRVGRATLLVVAPIGPTLLVGYDATVDVRNSQLVAWALVLAAALLVHFHRRASRAVRTDRELRLRGWLIVGMIMAAIYGLVLAAVVGQIAAPRRDGWPLVGEIALVLILTLVVWAAAETRTPRGPALAGTLLGLGLTVAMCGILAVAPPLRLSRFEADLLTTVLALAGLLLAWTVLTRVQVAMWVRRRFAVAVVLFTFAHFVANVDQDRWAVALAILANLQAAVLIVLACHALLRQSVLDQERELQDLYASLAEVRASHREDRELLHEVGSTVAGIATASAIMREAPELSPQRRQRLEHMLRTELARLERLVFAPLPAAASSFLVDEVVEPLVTSHQERGLDVRWTPSRLRAMGDSDDLAEVVNILLENARRHGGRTAWIDVTTSDGFVEVRCADDGPGVASEIRTDLFTSGVRRSDSPGQGLGLSIARHLMSSRGGSLELTESINRGATFVARLPVSELADATQHHVA